MTAAIIEVRDLVKIFDRRKTVLDGVSFSIGKGDFVTVHGKSGCGKTTLLNILGGLDRPTSGEVYVDGHSMANLSEDDLAKIRLKNIGFVFQDSNLLMDLTVRENIALPLKFSGRRDRGQIEELMNKFDIAQVSHEKANSISGGEAQRTAIARALMNEPKIILADEPTGSLDTENTEKVMEAFSMVRRDFDITIVLATHDNELAMYSTSKILLAGGKAVVEATGGA